jgi:plastocyanin
MATSRRATAVLLCGVTMLVVAACGGDKKDAGLATQRVTTTSAVSTTTTALAPADAGTSTTVAAVTSTTAPRAATTAAPRTSGQLAVTNPPATNPPATAPPTTTAPSGTGSAVTIQSSTFMPAVLNVTAGTKVTATNKDSYAHTWTADGGQWNSMNLSQNGSYSYTFSTPGTYAYHCNIHASMHGTVKVT